MNSVSLEVFGHYNPHHENLKKLGLTACERDVFGKIAGLSRSVKEVFVHLKEFAENLGYAKESICRAVKVLIKKGFLRKTGKLKYGFYPVVEILTPENQSLVTPLTATSMLIDLHVNACELAGQSKEIRTDLIKPTDALVNQYSEKNLLKQKLRDLGLSLNKTKSLLQRFPQERIERQIANLKDQLAKNLEINNPAGWLLKAIEKNYHPEIKLIQPEQEDQKSRESYNLLKSAELCESRQEYDEATKLAQQSLAMKPNKATQELINRIEHVKTKEAHQAQALANIPQEEFERVLVEEIAKQKTLFMRLGISKVSELHIKAAQAATIERLAQEKT